jgi:hypothetical protein
MLAKDWNLIFLVALLLMFLVIWFSTGISPKQRNRKVKVMVTYYKKAYEIRVRIESTGKLPVEILAPELKFYNRETSRAFTIKSPGNSFPLGLYPLTDFQFKIDLYKFYYHDVSLKDFKKVKLIIRERTGRLLKSVTVRV